MREVQKGERDDQTVSTQEEYFAENTINQEI